MKYWCLLFFIVLTISCKSKSSANVAITSQSNKTSCPDNGYCTLERFNNKTLQVKRDGLNKIYLEIAKGENFVLKFEYKKKSDNKLMDGSYREEVFIELNPDDLDFETTDFKSRKLFFARWCYCKGQTGYYRISEGKLAVARLNVTEAQLNLEFKIDEVPQIINRISETFSLQ
ncbi:hypothetical protein [Flavisericum labens]|uniref:hypothetical protein n=1 Tax=Flavisericum labens TaxID=3377112 RepID=UPI00387B67E7